MDQKTVSVIISVYNSEKFIKGRLENLIEQTIFDKIEIIIINSGSEQNEESIITDYLLKYKNIKYIKTLERETIYRAWNRGIKISTGKYLTNANTDDRLRRDALEILSKALDENPDKAIVYADQYITDIPNPSFNSLKKSKRLYRLDYSRLKQLWGYIAGPQSMWRASLHTNDDLWFDEKFEVSGDNDFVCRVAEKYEMMRIPDVLGIYYKASDNSNKEFKNFNETYKENLEVRDKYIRRYLNNLALEQRRKLQFKFWIYEKTPSILVSLIRRIIQFILPSKQIPTREFIFLIASINEELNGNLNKSLKYCQIYLKSAADNLIRKQYKHIISLQNLKT